MFLLMYGAVRSLMCIYSLIFLMMPLDNRSPFNETATYQERIAGWQMEDNPWCLITVYACRTDSSHGDPAMYYNGVMNLWCVLWACGMVPAILSFALILKTKTYVKLYNKQDTELLDVVPFSDTMRATCKKRCGDRYIFSSELNRLTRMGLKPTNPEMQAHYVELLEAEADQEEHVRVRRVAKILVEERKKLKKDQEKFNREVRIERFRVDLMALGFDESDTEKATKDLTTTELINSSDEDFYEIILDECVLKLIQDMEKDPATDGESGGEDREQGTGSRGRKRPGMRLAGIEL